MRVKIEEWEPGTYRKMQEYRCFIPATVNHQWVWENPRINSLLERAVRQLAELDARSRDLPDVDWFIYMHVSAEATASSRIEGTRTEIEELILKPQDVPPEKRLDRQEVLNYIHAMNYALERLPDLPLSNRLLRNTHRILWEGVRGEYKAPGEFRHSQNWIGGSSPGNAFYVPPEAGAVAELMGDLELFWHNDEIDVPHLVRVAISHYQFESIHPFLDGNGRIGRLLIPLYLIANGMLDAPTLYFSQYIERHRNEYYDALQRPRVTGDIGGWIIWFLDALAAAAETGVERINKIIELRRRVNELVLEMGKSASNGDKLLRYLFTLPGITVSEVSAHLNLAYNPANHLVNRFVKSGILKKWGERRRNRYFIFDEYLRLFK